MNATGRSSVSTGAQPLGLVVSVEAVLEALHEVGVAIGSELEQRERRLPPGRDGDVVVLAQRLLAAAHVQVWEMLIAMPAGPLLLAHEHQRHLPARDRAERARVLHHHAHTAGELQVVDEKGDLHALGSAGSEGCSSLLAAGASPRSAAIASALPDSGRPSSPSSSWI